MLSLWVVSKFELESMSLPNLTNAATYRIRHKDYVELITIKQRQFYFIRLADNNSYNIVMIIKWTEEL